MADRINFTQPINDSAQVGDILFFSTVSALNNETTSIPQQIGPITAIGENFVEVANGSAPAGWTAADIETGTVTVNGVTVPIAPPLFMFRKNAQANVSTLLGYFANIRITHNDNDRAELYSVGSEIFSSSK